MFGLEEEFLKNPTDYRSYVVCIPILWCVMWWGLSAKQRDAPNPSGRLVSSMVYARKLGRGEEEGREERTGGNRGDGRWNRGELKEERRRGEGKTRGGKGGGGGGMKGGGKRGGVGGTGEGETEGGR